MADFLNRCAGRTGRFGRKGVSINFVHDERSWQDMHAIEEHLGRSVIRVDTSDVDVMEDVRPIDVSFHWFVTDQTP